ncbi:MAG: hypothetical protein R6U64_05310 [Bacteroidales bacterium]
MKTAIQIGLAIAIIVLAYFVYDSIMEPVRFNQEASIREARVIQRLKDIRSVQLAHRTKYGTFNGSLDSLVWFVENDSLPVVNAIGSVPDTLTESEAIELGIVSRDTIWVAARDTILKNTRYPLDSLPYVPFSGGKRFEMQTAMIERGQAQLPVFEAFTLPEDYMRGLEYPVYYTRMEGLRVGSLTQASFDGNWE